MSFRKYGGLQYSANNNITRSYITNNEQEGVTDALGDYNTKIISKSHLDLSGNSLINVGAMYFYDGSIFNTSIQKEIDDLASYFTLNNNILQPNFDIYSIHDITGNTIHSTGLINAGGLITAQNGITVTGIDSSGNSIDTTGKINAGGLITAKNGIDASTSTITGNAIVANGLITANKGITVKGDITVTCDISGNSIDTTGKINAGGLITAQNGIDASTSTITGNAIVANGLITANNGITVKGDITVTCDISGNSIDTTGKINAGGLITANNGIDASGSTINTLSLVTTNLTLRDGTFSTTTITANTITANTTLTSSGSITALGSITGGSITASGSITALGSITGGSITGGSITGGSFHTTSDYRIKEDITSLDAYSIDDLRPISYWNTLSCKRDIGFLAHELQEQIPFLVNGEKDGTERQTIQYNGLIGLLVKELQDAKKRISILEEKLNI